MRLKIFLPDRFLSVCEKRPLSIGIPVSAWAFKSLGFAFYLTVIFGLKSLKELAKLFQPE